MVSPASLKSEWEEQIAKFSDLPSTIVFGGYPARCAAYRRHTFFTLCNYEQVVADGKVLLDELRPDVVILDEAQRIKNWQTKTANAVKMLESRYAFVLTGTPLELQELRQKGPGRNDERTTRPGEAISIDVVGIHRDLERERRADLVLVASQGRTRRLVTVLHLGEKPGFAVAHHQEVDFPLLLVAQVAETEGTEAHVVPAFDRFQEVARNEGLGPASHVPDGRPVSLIPLGLLAQGSRDVPEPGSDEETQVEIAQSGDPAADGVDGDAHLPREVDVHQLLRRTVSQQPDHERELIELLKLTQASARSRQVVVLPKWRGPLKNAICRLLAKCSASRES